MKAFSLACHEAQKAAGRRKARLPNGQEFVVAVLTRGVKTVPDVIPRVFEKVAARFAGPRPN